MSIRQTPAIILQIRDYGEADRLVHFLTPESGRVSGVAKHAKNSRRRFANCLEPLSRVVFHLSPRPRGDLEFLQQAELVNPFSSLRRDLKRLAAAALLAELAGELAGPTEARAAIFDTLQEGLELLENGTPPDSLLPAFLLHLMGLGGYAPRWQPCLECGHEPVMPLYFQIARGGVICGPCSRTASGPMLPLSRGAWKLLALAQTLPRDKLSRLRFPLQQRDQSLAIFQRLLAHLLGRELKSWSFWHKVAAR